jgi:bifunctional DNA-binding transcriptional regulator/antitoxin component of YhaV-PrlF toxin-antitoxin module
MSKDKRGSSVVAETRMLVKVGNSVYLSIPKEWLERHHLKAGDFVPVLTDNILKVVPMSEIQ